VPVERCSIDGKPGYRWGEEGKCYTYDPDDSSSRAAALARAHEQGVAVESSKHSRERMER